MNNFPFYPYYGYYKRQNPYFPNRRPYPDAPFVSTSPPHPKKEEHYQEKENLDDSKEEPIFEILGLQLFYDDILLICLIFFLYSEGIKDYYLFLTLVLILLT